MSSQYKRSIPALLAALALASLSACNRSSASASPHVATAKLHIQGVMCPLCLPKVDTALHSVHGYHKMDAEGLDHLTVTYDPRDTSPDALVAAINSKTSFHAGQAH